MLYNLVNSRKVLVQISVRLNKRRACVVKISQFQDTRSQISPILELIEVQIK